MPAPKPVNTTKVVSTSQKPNSRLTKRRSFTDSNRSAYDFQNIHDNVAGNSNNEIFNNKDPINTQQLDVKNESDNNIQSTGGDDKNSNNNNKNNNKNNNNNNGSRTLLSKFSLVLENKASVARDHLANERTFLAWLRTSLSFISIGVAITQLFRLTRPAGQDERTVNDKGGKLLGIIFVLLGIVFLGLGIMRYFHSQYLMTCGHFPASRGSIIIGTLLTVLVLSACFVIILLG